VVPDGLAALLGELPSVEGIDGVVTPADEVVFEEQAA
jgi:hypothetical protein